MDFLRAQSVFHWQRTRLKHLLQNGLFFFLDSCVILKLRLQLPAQVGVLDGSEESVQSVTIAQLNYLLKNGNHHRSELHEGFGRTQSHKAVRVRQSFQECGDGAWVRELPHSDNRPQPDKPGGVLSQL